MTKARILADFISDGSSLADGAISVAEVAGAMAAANNLSDVADATTAKTNLGLSTVATTGAYADLASTPILATVATSGAYADVSGTPTLATVATSGAYADVTGTPAAALPLTGGTLSGGLSVTGTVAATAVTGNGSALTSLTSANLTGALPAISGAALTDLSGTPTGALLYFAASTAPTGFIKANGASLSTTTYADLFAIVAYTYGGSGASFTLPDLRGEFMRGWDDSRGVDGGRGFGSAQAGQNESHGHEVDALGPHSGGYQYSTGRAAFSRGYPNNLAGVYSHAVSIISDGNMPVGLLWARDKGGTEARPRNVALLACIKY